MKPVVALDLDDLIYPFMDALVPFHNSRYGTDLSLADFHSFEFDKVWGGTRKEAMEKVVRFFTEMGKHPEPIEHAAAAIEKLSKEYSLVIVTSRTDEMESATRKWVDKHFPVRFEGVYLCNSYVQDGRPSKRTKASVVAEIGAVALVDDSLEHVTEVAKSGRVGILFGEYAWNRSEELPENVVRCLTWDGVVAQLLQPKS